MNKSETNQQVLVAVPQITKQDFLKAVVDTLGNYQWPKGSIESINPNNAKLVYVWGNRFKGQAEGTWTAKVDGTVKITVNNKETNIQDGTPYAGTIPSIEFDLLVVNDNQSVPYWAKDYCKIGYEGGNFQPYSSIEAIGATVEGDNSGVPHSTWMKNGNTIADNFLLPTATDISECAGYAYLALNIVPAEVIQQSWEMFKNMKCASRDVAVSSRNSVTEDPTPVLIPFYVLEFQFEGKNNYIAMMADKRCLIKGQIPPVKKETAKSPQEIVVEEMPDKVKQSNMVKWGWVLAIVIFFVTNLTVAVVYLIAWAIAMWFVKKPIKDRIKELEQEEADNMQQIALKLRKQLLG